jgi:uncharacterized protein (TIGR02246 family)
MRTERLAAANIALIYKLWKEYSEAINSGNMESWIALWHSDSIQMPPDMPQLCGKAEIRKYAEALGNRFPTEFAINPDVVQILGDHAYSHGTFSCLVTLGEGEKKRISGKFLSVLKKQEDGFWKILVDCFNYDGVLEPDDPGFIPQK